MIIFGTTITFQRQPHEAEILIQYRLAMYERRFVVGTMLQ